MFLCKKNVRQNIFLTDQSLAQGQQQQFPFLCPLSRHHYIDLERTTGQRDHCQDIIQFSSAK